MKRMKKLIAALMAVAMIASLNISAFATTFNGAASTAAVSGTTVGTSTTDNGFTDAAATTADKAQGNATGTIGYEGKMPEGVVHIVMPAVPAGTFDMLLDPNNLIGEVAAGGEAATQRISGITANSDYVYFANAADSERNIEAGWSSSSDKLTITNKGYWPLKVKLTAEVQKGSTAADGSLIQLVDAKSKLGSLTDVPAMYMEVASGTNKGVVADSYGTPSMAVAAVSGEEQIIIGNPIFKWDATNGGLNRDRKMLNNALNGVVLQISAASATTVTAKFMEGTGAGARGIAAAGATSFAVKPDGTYDDATVANNTWTVSIAESSTASEKIDLSDGKGQVVGVFNIQMKKTADTGSAKTYATVKVAVDPVNVSKWVTGTTAGTNPGGTITFGKNNSNSTGSTEVLTVTAPQNAYMVTYSTDHYVKTLTEAAKGSDFVWPTLDFNISAAINKTTAWDDLAATSGNAQYNVKNVTGLTTKVIWDVANNYDGDPTIDHKPRVKVTKYAVSAGDSLEFMISNFGKGSDAAIAIIGLDAGLGKISCPTIGKPVETPADSGKFVITELAAKDGKWQTFVQTATGNTANATTLNQLFQCSPKTVSDGAKATLTYLKADLTTDTVTFTYGVANA